VILIPEQLGDDAETDRAECGGEIVARQAANVAFVFEEEPVLGGWIDSVGPK
jgi:hypothetical protein